MTDKTIQQEAKELRELKLAYQERKAEYESLKSQFDKLQSALLERMENESVEGIKHDGINFVPVETIYGKVEDRREFVEWAKENMPELLEEKERKDVLNETARQMLDDNEILPPGMGFTTRKYISQRVAK